MGVPNSLWGSWIPPSIRALVLMLSQYKLRSAYWFEILCSWKQQYTMIFLLTTYLTSIRFKEKATNTGYKPNLWTEKHVCYFFIEQQWGRFFLEFSGLMMKKAKLQNSLAWDPSSFVSVFLRSQTHQNLRDRSLTPQSPADSLLTASNTDSHWFSSQGSRNSLHRGGDTLISNRPRKSSSLRTPRWLN